MELITVVLASLGVAQALFLSLYLIKVKHGNRLANFWLAMVLVGLSIRIGKSIFNHFIVLEPWQRNLGLSGILLVGPSLWLYGRALADRGIKFSADHALHFLPAFIYVVFSGFIPNNFTSGAYISYLLVMSHWLTYLMASEYQRRKVVAVNSTADLERWYRYILIGAVGLWLYYMAVFLRIIPYYIGGAIMYSALIYAFSFLLLQRHRFALEKYAGSAATPEQGRKIVAQLAQLFAEEKSFLDPKFSLQKAADKLGVTTRRLSQAVNQQEHCNFSEYVNRHRIAKAREMLADPVQSKLKLAALAFECGFNNVTSFNLAFKAQTGKPPSVFREEVSTRG